jgi:nucleotide-binding universal stress UspA family protein
MLKPIQSILFATDLTPNCQQALDFTIVLATRFKATIYMLHVIERLPNNMDEKLKDLLGKHQWEDLVSSHQANARRSLLGKQSTNSRVREAVNNFCKEVGIPGDACDFHSSEIIISDGELVEEILAKAAENECDLIVLGGHKTLFSDASAFGSTTKAVLKRAKIPVTIAPPLAVS